MSVKWENVKYFKMREFNSPDMPGSGAYMNSELIEKLDYMRQIFDRPLIINSGYRTPEYNDAIGGERNSAHLRGNAADIRCVFSFDRLFLIELSLKIGFKRIGIAKSFIHVDVDPMLPQGVLWVY